VREEKVREGLYRTEGREREKGGGRDSKGGSKLDKGPRVWTLSGWKNKKKT